MRLNDRDRSAVLVFALSLCCIGITAHVQRDKPRPQPYTQTRSQYPPLPGTDVVGNTFDVAKMTPALPAVQLTWNGGFVFQSALYRDKMYSYPDQFFPPFEQTSGLALNVSIVTLNASSIFFQNDIIDKDSDDGFLGFGASKSYTETFTAFQNFNGRSESVIIQFERYGWFTVQLDDFPPPAIDSILQRYFLSLPPTWSADNTTAEWKAYARFISLYGTHYVLSATMGAMSKATSWFAECFLLSAGQEWCVQESSDSYWGLANDENYNYRSQSGASAVWNDWSDQYQLIYGGDLIRYGPSQHKEWLSSIADNPYPISLQISPLCNLLSAVDTVRAANLKLAVGEYLNATYTIAQQTAESFIPVEPNPLPANCSGTSIHTRA